MMEYSLIENLNVAKDYIQGIVSYSRVGSVIVPDVDIVDEEYKRQTTTISKAYYRGENIEEHLLNW